MNIHEYQAKDLLRQYGVPVPAGSVAHSVEQAAAVARPAASSWPTASMKCTRPPMP